MFFFIFILFSIVVSLAFAKDEDEDEYEFDVSTVKNKTFELNGYVESTPLFYNFDQNSAFYKLQHYNQLQRKSGIDGRFGLLLEGKYQKGNFKGYAQSYTQSLASSWGGTGKTTLYQGYVSVRLSDSVSIDVGKKTLMWGKGYAWNPVDFLDKPKNPEDPELPIEGSTLLTADFTKSLKGSIKTITFTPVYVPVYKNTNESLGITTRHTFGGKLYLLAYDTDIDLIFLTDGNNNLKYGFDFSKNLLPSLEIHGEYAGVNNYTSNFIDSNGNLFQKTYNPTSYLIGIRYQTKYDTTFIAEYYRNGTGFDNQQMDDLYSFINNSFANYQATGNNIPLMEASGLQDNNYGGVNPMKDYFYLRVSKKDPFNIPYFTPAITSIYNLDDNSFSLAPELLYSPVTNWEFRLKIISNIGPRNTEFGEKPSNFRTELRLRYYF